jgi:hypothetical protein
MFFPGLILGASLIVFVCALSDECGPHSSASASAAVATSSAYSDRTRQYLQQSRYGYGWSFSLAVLAFVTAEVSAMFCLHAFLRRFDSEVRVCSNSTKTAFNE